MLCLVLKENERKEKLEERKMNLRGVFRFIDLV